MKLTDLTEDKKMQFWREGNDKSGYDVMSAEGGHHDHYDTKKEADAAVKKLNTKYNRDPHLK